MAKDYAHIHTRTYTLSHNTLSKKLTRAHNVQFMLSHMHKSYCTTLRALVSLFEMCTSTVGLTSTDNFIMQMIHWTLTHNLNYMGKYTVVFATRHENENGTWGSTYTCTQHTCYTYSIICIHLPTIPRPRQYYICMHACNVHTHTHMAGHGEFDWPIREDYSCLCDIFDGELGLPPRPRHSTNSSRQVVTLQRLHWKTVRTKINHYCTCTCMHHNYDNQRRMSNTLLKVPSTQLTYVHKLEVT